MATTKARIERLEALRRNPFDRDPRYRAALARLGAGQTVQDLTDDELAGFVNWTAHEDPRLAALSDEDLEAIAQGDTRVLTRDQEGNS